jgi:hypothetical protein
VVEHDLKHDADLAVHDLAAVCAVVVIRPILANELLVSYHRVSTFVPIPEDCDGFALAMMFFLSGGQPI